MTLEERVNKLEKRRSRADKRPLHIAYAALVIGFASGAIGVVNAMAINEVTTRIARFTPPPRMPDPPKPKPLPKEPSTWGAGQTCGRDGGRYWCK